MKRSSILIPILLINIILLIIDVIVGDNNVSYFKTMSILGWIGWLLNELEHRYYYGN